MLNQDIIQMNPEQRQNYLIKQVNEQQQIWILTDEHGCVMLNTEDEDCVPVWPDEYFANLWATGEWSHCTPLSISLQTWIEKWTPGLMGDDLCVAVFPNPEEEGLVVFPDVFEQSILKQKAQ